jgi:hypothetical protein
MAVSPVSSEHSSIDRPQQPISGRGGYETVLSISGALDFGRLVSPGSMLATDDRRRQA